MVHLYFGEGKGKTTAAAGLALRAAGQGKRVIYVRFMKGRSSGEIESFGRIPGIMVLCGDFSVRFTFQMTEEERQEEAAKNEALLEEAFSLAFSKEAELLILDEAVTAAAYGMICEERLAELTERGRNVFEIVMTGRAPSPGMIESADYVTEMVKIKHPYDAGVPARQGIGY